MTSDDAQRWALALAEAGGDAVCVSGQGSGPVLLSAAFFARPTETVARDLIGTLLLSHIGGLVTGGRIVETEAYLGADDPGSHAATRGITARNRVMYGPPGVAYVYFTYGAHYMLNLVTEEDGTAGAVLVRALEPLVGIDVMSERRAGRRGHDVASGPGKLAQALGIDLRHNGTRLGGEIALFAGERAEDGAVGRSGRVGLSAGHELALRYYVQGSRYISRGRTGPKAVRPRSPEQKGQA